MMPICAYKRCNKVSEKSIGDIDSGDVDGYGKKWLHPAYVCDKHYKKLLKLLGMGHIL